MKIQCHDVTLNPLRWFACIFLRIPLCLICWAVEDYLLPLLKLYDKLPTLDAPEQPRNPT